MGERRGCVAACVEGAARREVGGRWGGPRQGRGCDVRAQVTFPHQIRCACCAMDRTRVGEALHFKSL